MWTGATARAIFPEFDLSQFPDNEHHVQNGLLGKRRSLPHGMVLFHPTTSGRSKWNKFLGGLALAIQRRPDETLGIGRAPIYVRSCQLWFVGS
jgi:hypothetical protein